MRTPLFQHSHIHFHSFLKSQRCYNNMGSELWTNVLKKLISENKTEKKDSDAESFQLATLPAIGEWYPRVRTVALRGFVGCGWDYQSTEKAALKTDLLVFSTDLLMKKSRSIIERQRETLRTKSVLNGYELCNWLPKTLQQMRLAGQIWIYLPELLANGEFPGHELIQKHKLPNNASVPEDWSWEKERVRLWSIHSASLRGTFACPEPYSPIDPNFHYTPLPEKLTGDESETVRKNWEEAFHRFALVVCEVQHFELLEAAPPPGRHFVTKPINGEWVCEELN
ncbi:fungal protein [Schizosaccharomyces japonicus yFS275]|uniref:Fungal protein n=1 Tax=Schizosaccharomyces japonicus (strain yFS275 / FY16936) TaxID=402676 RepID=B6JWD3_SCHJY|nr:fungal protein [Schizosaccharomyces japonicus yFS275]EEB05684.2 fungal protein [Schizosaccharomyces japonicus yFS275]